MAYSQCSHHMRPAYSLLATLFLCYPAWADDKSGSTSSEVYSVQTLGGGIFGSDTGSTKSGHVHLAQPPAGVMGVYMAPKGDFMFNYMPMWMHMSGVQTGTTYLSPEQVAATVPAYRGGMGMGGPQTIRIVPEWMNANMQMLGGMYGITDNINLMFMANYTEKSMNMVTFKGMKGTTPLGSSTVNTDNWGDTSASVLVKLYDGHGHEVHVFGGVSFPTGSITETGNMLSPKGSLMNMRLMYGMQTGDGTYDALPSIVYNGNHKDFAWGLMYQGRFPMQSYNSNGWRQGNLNSATGWVGYQINHHFTATLRVSGSTQDSIHGADPEIKGLSTGVNPNYYGGDLVNGLVGLSGRMPFSMVGIPGGGAGRIALEFGAPLYVNVNGIQSPEKWVLSLSTAARF